MMGKKTAQVSVTRTPQTKSRIIKEAYKYIDSKGVREFNARDDLLPKGVVTGHIQLEQKSDDGPLSVRYNADRYGVIYHANIKQHLTTQQEEIQRLKQEQENQKKEAEKRAKQAYEKGIKEGYEKGLIAGRSEITQPIDQLRQILTKVTQATQEYFAGVEDRLVEFAMQIARKVVGDIAEEKRDIAVRLANEAIKLAIDKTRLVLFVSPIDYQTLKEAKADLQAVSEGIKEIEIEINHRLQPGSVILETVGGSIDATISTMLDEVHRAILPNHEVKET